MAGTPAQLSAGRIGRAHGLDGSFYVTGPKPSLLTLGRRVTVAGRALEIVRRVGTDARPIVRLQGISDRAAAEALRGAELTVEAHQAPALAEGEWWAHELQGCEVRGGEVRLGTVTRLIELPSCEALEVQPAEGGEPLLVPMVKAAVLRVEPVVGLIEVDLEFLGLAAPRGERGRGRDPERGRSGSESA